MKIVTIDLDRLRNTGYVQYMRNYLDILDSLDFTLLKVAPEAAALTAQIDAIELVVKQDQASALTETISNLDIQRDGYLVGIAGVADSYRKHYDQSMVQAAKALSHHIGVYGQPSTIAAEPLQQQTGTVNNLVHDLQNDPVLSSAVTMLGLSDWVSQLQLVNTQLNDAYVERSEERGDMPAEKVKDLRITGNELYYGLRDMLMAQALIAAYASPFEEAINRVNALTTDYNDVLARREGGEDDTGGEDPELPV